MKLNKILLVVLVLCATMTNAQFSKYEVKDRNNDTTYVFEYSPILKAHLDEYFLNAFKMNMDLSNLSNLGGIFWSNSIEYYGPPSYGLTLLYKDFSDIVLINDEIPLYLPTFINAVVYHELFHVFLHDVRHPKDGPYILRGGKKTEVEKVIRIWNDSTKIEYFNYLKLKMK